MSLDRTAPDPVNATYRIDAETVTLASGGAERPAAPGSATKVVTTLGDQVAHGDLDGDGRTDTVAILTRETGGSGIFYSVAALLNSASGVSATPAVFLGDRIKVGKLRLDGRTVVVEMLDRAAGQPLTASPTVATARRFALSAGTLVAK